MGDYHTDVNLRVDSRNFVTMHYVTQETNSLTGPDAWSEVDTVLLDMDGTLLDLRFDNFFWLEVVPERFAERHSLSIDEARAVLTPRFASKQGTLHWYCTDYWSRELGLDIAQLKEGLRTHVRYLPGAEEFLKALHASRLRAVLVTNAHRDPLRIKARETGLFSYLDAAVSSHQYGVPKEHPEFWLKVQADLDFDPARTLFVDDSLAVLRAARNHGLGFIIAIAHPDSTLGLRTIEEFASVPRIVDLLGFGNLARAKPV